MVAQDFRVRRVVNDLLAQQQARRLCNRRSGDRHDFMAAVNIQDIERLQNQTSGLSIELSVSGVRLVHRSEMLESGQYLLTFQNPANSTVSIRSELKWCVKVGEDWHSSGWTFLGIRKE